MSFIKNTSISLKKIQYKLAYYALRLLLYPFSWLSYSALRAIGRFLGSVAFFCLVKERKRVLSNLALATSLSLSEKRLFQIARTSFQNLAINLLEYVKFSKEKDFSTVVSCENPEVAQKLSDKKQGIVFFCGHQANWEALFLEGSSRMPGIAIGKPTKNPFLYEWIVSIRESQGGKIIDPRKALREGLSALRKGHFVGIVGDQGMPGSSFSSLFLGRRAWTSTAPALLAYRSRSPLIVAMTRRVKKGYRIRYSDPIWPNYENGIDQEVPRLMREVLSILENSISECPEEWLWQHNRWKQQTPEKVYRPFRHDSLCIALPEDPIAFEKVVPHLELLKKIYANNFLFIFVPQAFRNQITIEAEEIWAYREKKELFKRDYRFKMLFDFTPYCLGNYYSRLGVLKVINEKLLRKLAESPEGSFSDLFKKVLCRPGFL